METKLESKIYFFEKRFQWNQWGHFHVMSEESEYVEERNAYWEQRLENVKS